MSHLALSLLGPSRIECDGKPIEIRRRKAMALLVYLSVTGRSHSRDALATLFWPEQDQSQARVSLRRALAALRKALRQPFDKAQDAALGEGWLDVDRETVGLNRDAEVWLDVDEFRDRLAECRTHGHPQDQVCPACLPLLTEAAALYRDDFLTGFTLRDSPGFDEWQFFQTEGLRDELASALERLAQGYSGQGEFERAIAYARRWLALDPLREAAHRCLMRLYAWSGQRAAALRQYGECERILREELGVPPGEETTQVYEGIKSEKPRVVEQFTGTVTFLFTDIEGSTELWGRYPEAMQTALARHDAFLRREIAAHGGYIVKFTGDGFHAAFATASDALAAALAAQRALHAQAWGDAVIKVRMGLHSGATEERAGDYFGPATNRAARLMSAGHGGQILLSLATQQLVRDELPAQVELRDLGKHRLKDLIRPEHIFQVVAPDLPADFPPLKTLDYRPNNLPIQPTFFVGREAMLAEIEDRLQDPACRLLTLVGPGGSGKTRLALEAAAAQLDNYAHGVFFVPLAPLQSVEAVVPTVAEALGLRFYEGGEPQKQLLDYLRQKSMLLILDNFEHLLDGMDLVADILKTAPDVRILTTSRARLNVQGEYLCPVAGMDFPAREITEDATLRRAQDVAQYCAVKLFLTSARRAQPGFELTADNLTDVVRICRLVQGMPLGILLAAAWVGMLTPAEIAAEISQSLDFLETDWRDAPERQRSIRAAFDHSWHLLTEQEREVFQGLSVFRGGFTRQAARQVTGASLRELMTLVNKSLLHRTPTPLAGLGTGGRYEMHELLRQYAAGKLDGVPAASQAVHDRHCAYYAAALQQWEADLQGPRQQVAMAEMDVDTENARVAWNWAVEQGQVERVDQALVGLCRFYAWRGRFQEGEVACQMAASMLAGEKLAATASGEGPVLSSSASLTVNSVEGLRVLAQVLSIRAFFNRRLGHTELARQLLGQSLALLERSELDDQSVRLAKAFALLEMGDVVVNSDREEARRLYEQGLTLFRGLGDRYGAAKALYALGEVAWHLGAYDEAQQWHEESLAIRQALGDQRGIANSLRGLSAIAVWQGQLEEGEHLIRQSIAIHREIGDRVGIADGLRDLGLTLNFLGQYAETHTPVEESIALYRDLGFRDGLAWAHSVLGWAKWHLGQYEQARAQAQMCLTLSREAGYRLGSAVGLGVLGGVALTEGKYAEARQLLQESVAVNQEIGQREALGWNLAGLGGAALGLGNVPQARQHFCQALQTATEIRSFMPLALTIPLVALFLAVQGEMERAVELYALASRYPLVANSRVAEDVVGGFIAAVAATLPPDVITAAQARGQARDLDATVAELLAELGE
jgi:predicted ATPase/class 3 adenylate cyclase